MKMTPEAEFMFYRDVLIRNAIRLEEINIAATYLAGITVKLPSTVGEEIPNMVYADSRHDEYEMIEFMTKWFEKHPDGMPLFDREGNTLALISGEGYPNVLCRNSGYHVHRIIELSKGYTWDRVTGGSISFQNFRAIEIEWTLERMREEAEVAMERRRDVHTTMVHYAEKNDRAKLIKSITEEPIPAELTDGRTGWTGAPIYSLWWMTQVLGDDIVANGVMERVWTIINSSKPEEDEPPVITTFGSHTSNRVTLGVDKTA